MRLPAEQRRSQLLEVAVRLFAEHGAKVVFADVLDGSDVARDIGANAVFAKLDVSKAEAWQALVNETLERWGRIDVLVNNAGITRDRMFLKMTREDWDAVIDTNLKSVFRACRAAIKINMRLDASKIDYLLRELAQTEYPMSCPHGRPIALRYATRDILKSFHRI